MTQASGEIISAYTPLIINATIDTTVAVGDLIACNTTSWSQAAATSPGPFAVAYDATNGGEARIVIAGIVTVNKKTGAAIAAGHGVMPSATAGQVMQWSVAAVNNTGAWNATASAAVDAAILDVGQLVGTAVENATSGQTYVKVLLGKR